MYLWKEGKMFPLGSSYKQAIPGAQRTIGKTRDTSTRTFRKISQPRTSNILEHFRTNVNPTPEESSETQPNTIEIYVDGACKGNHQKNHDLRTAGYGVYFGDNDPRNLHGRLPGTQANGAAELYAIYRALLLFEHTTDILEIHPDSMYGINTIDKWMWNWAKKGWRKSNGKSIENKEIVQNLYRLCQRMKDRYKLSWVKGHSGIHGNEKADALAELGCNLPREENFIWEL